ncbi:MAG: hypothetical protein J6Q92_04045 [Oscillospiraceae bacterium]|nr:hypothetical protein [Oscillospiraceae bacterium]
MDTFLKATAGLIIALVFYLILAKQNKDYSLILTVAVCCLLAVCLIGYIQPVVAFISRLQILGQLNVDMMKIILKAVGIALLSEVVSLICNDAGNASLGKMLQFLASAVILWLSLPLFTSLIDLLEKILGAI